MPELINKVIADSFEGEKPFEAFTENVKADRNFSKHDENAKMFYAFMHGSDWEQIVDNDTNAIIRHEKEIDVFFHKPLQFLKAVRALLEKITVYDDHFIVELKSGIEIRIHE